MPYKLSELPNVSLYSSLKQKQLSDNLNRIMTYVNQHIEETGQQDTQYPIIENQTGDLIFFGSGSGENFDENWQKVIVSNTIPEIDETIVPLHININFENF